VFNFIIPNETVQRAGLAKAKASVRSNIPMYNLDDNIVTSFCIAEILI